MTLWSAGSGKEEDKTVLEDGTPAYTALYPFFEELHKLKRLHLHHGPENTEVKNIVKVRRVA